tara:strand:- start:33650 stop:35056 length:1407 start_codon:yes stop_codon:yes gene_type:complete
MNTKNSIKIIVSVFLLTTLVYCGSSNGKQSKSSDISKAATEKKPNIVVILADDLGYGDVGYHGSDIQTPNIDKLAKEGIKLESFYVAPMCSPTRAGLLTGRYPVRFGMMRAVIPPGRNYGLDPNEDMLPEMLQRAGYKHRAAIGKWHLGNMEDKWLPNNQGFTHFVGCYEGAIDYFTHFRDDKLDWHKNGELYNQEGYSTDLIAEESVAFINNVPKEEPYFLYVPFNAPHSPFQAKESDIAKYPNRTGKKKTYAAMVDCMDQGIGKIMQAIESRGDLENTFIIFMSDNGGVKNVGDNAPMKGAKLTPYEGGIRVAAVAYWKGQNITGGKTINDRVGYIDIFPTLKEVAGLQQPEVNPLDGSSILGLLKGNETIPKRDWYTYMDQNGERRQRLAVHSGDWKAVVEKDAPDALEKNEAVEELYDLSNTHIEGENLKDSQLKIASELSAKLDGFLKLIKEDQVARYGDEKE